MYVLVGSVLQPRCIGQVRSNAVFPRAEKSSSSVGVGAGRWVVLVLKMDNGHGPWWRLIIGVSGRTGRELLLRGQRTPDSRTRLENRGLQGRDGGTYPAGDTVPRYLGRWGSASH